MQNKMLGTGLKLLFSSLFLFGFGWQWAVRTTNAQTGKPVSASVALREARQVTTKLTNKLQLLLLKHVQKDNFEEAVQVCATIAQDTMHQFNQRSGHTVRRVSLGFRNPADMPDEYERQKLEAFDQFNREQKLAKEYSEVIEENGHAYLRYMKPIMTGPLCTNCHGQLDEIPSQVRKFLQMRYPDDQATGYRIGDVRGAVSVKILVQAKPATTVKPR